MTIPATKNELLRSLRERAETADPVGDTSPLVAAALSPASIDVANSLAEDTVIALGIDVQAGEQQVAVFANPYSDGREELLYINEFGDVQWVRHIQEEEGGLHGWISDAVASNAHSLVVAVHPDGSVWAFIVKDAIVGFKAMYAYQLQVDPDVPGGFTWGAGTIPEHLPPDTGLRLRPVQYPAVRPATPAVFVDVPSEKAVFCYVPTYPPDSGNGIPWRHGAVIALEPEDMGSPMVVGINSPDRASRYGVVEWASVYGVTNGRLFVGEYNMQDPTRSRYFSPIDFPANWTLIGTWTHPHGVGAVVLAVDPDTGKVEILTMIAVPQTENVLIDSSGALPTPLDDLVVWQDADLLLHVYGRDPDGKVQVLHQVSWEQNNANPGTPTPTWELRADGGPALRPLFAGVRTILADPYPDEMANLFVQYQGVDTAEATGLVSQDVGSTVWCEEKIRLVRDTPRPYIIARYQTMLTVRNAYGTPLPNVDLKLTADASVDLEVNQRFYRTDPNHPVTLTTDPMGRVTLRVPATGLAVPQIHVTANGLTQAVSIQQASDVHAFLQGTGTLPNHPEGFTAETVTNAKNSTGGFLFPDIQRDPDSADPTEYTAQDVVDTVRKILSSGSGQAASGLFAHRLGEGEQVLGLRLQRSDPSRPTFELITSQEELARAREDLTWDDVTDWLGDAWQAVKSGAADVGKIFIDFVEGYMVIGYGVLGAGLSIASWFWDGIQDTAAAIESFFSYLGASLDEVINWLTWVFDFGMALGTAKQLAKTLEWAPDLFKAAAEGLGQAVDNFFVEKEEEVTAWFESIKPSIAGTSYSSLQSPTGSVPPPSQPAPVTTSASDMMQSPHAHWLMEKLVNNGTSDTLTAVLAVGDPIDDLITELVDLIYSEDATKELLGAGFDLGLLFTNLFSGKDASAVLASEIATAIDLGEHVVLAVLKWLDALANNLLAWCEKAAEHAASILTADLDTSPLIESIWSFVIEEAGADPDDYPLTIGMVGMFVAAYPFTIVWKIINGDRPPFPHGIPDPRKPARLEGPPPIPWSDSLGGFQAFQGVVQTLDLILDGMLDYSAASLNPATGEKAFKVPDVVNRVFAAAHFVAYVIGDYPAFWGYTAPPVHTEREVLPYFRYVFTFYFNNIDLLVAFSNGSLAQQFEPKEGDPKAEEKEWVFAASTFMFGWMRIGCQIAEYLAIGPDEDREPNWFDRWNLWINLTAYIQTATGIVRYFYGKFPNEFWFGAVVVKSVIDVVGDVYSGVSTVVQPVTELTKPPKILAPDGSITFQAGAVDQWYTSNQVGVSYGYPGYDWDAIPSDPDIPALPTGLTLFYDTGEDIGYPGVLAVVQGWPTQEVTARKFLLAVSDGYGPSLIDQVECTISINPAPAGVPTAVSFTVQMVSDPAHTVTFSDTTDGSTDWYWDFGDGSNWSSVREATHTYAKGGRYTVTHRARNAQGWGPPSVQEILVEQ